MRNNHKNVLVLNSDGNLVLNTVFRSRHEALEWCNGNVVERESVHIRNFTKRNLLRKTVEWLSKEDISREDRSNAVFILNEVISQTEN